MLQKHRLSDAGVALEYKTARDASSRVGQQRLDLPALVGPPYKHRITVRQGDTHGNAGDWPANARDSPGASQGSQAAS